MHHGIGHMVGYPSLWISNVGTYPPPGTSDLLLTSGGHQWRLVQTCSLEDLPPTVLATQAGGMHPTGMLGCYK